MTETREHDGIDLIRETAELHLGMGFEHPG